MSFLEVAVYKNPQGVSKVAGEKLRSVEGLLRYDRLRIDQQHNEAKSGST